MGVAQAQHLCITHGIWESKMVIYGIHVGNDSSRGFGDTQCSGKLYNFTGERVGNMIIWLVVNGCHEFYFPINIGLRLSSQLSSQLTHIFQRGGPGPPTSNKSEDLGIPNFQGRVQSSPSLCTAWLIGIPLIPLWNSPWYWHDLTSSSDLGFSHIAHVNSIHDFHLKADLCCMGSDSVLVSSKILFGFFGLHHSVTVQVFLLGPAHLLHWIWTYRAAVFELQSLQTFQHSVASSSNGARHSIHWLTHGSMIIPHENGVRFGFS